VSPNADLAPRSVAGYPAVPSSRRCSQSGLPSGPAIGAMTQARVANASRTSACTAVTPDSRAAPAQARTPRRTRQLSSHVPPAPRTRSAARRRAASPSASSVTPRARSAARSSTE